MLDKTICWLYMTIFPSSLMKTRKISGSRSHHALFTASFQYTTWTLVEIHRGIFHCDAICRGGACTTFTQASKNLVLFEKDTHLATLQKMLSVRMSIFNDDSEFELRPVSYDKAKIRKKMNQMSEQKWNIFTKLQFFMYDRICMW